VSLKNKMIFLSLQTT